MEVEFLSDLSQDIGQIFFNGDNYDIIIQAGEDENIKEFFAHSLILSTRSTYFKIALSKVWAKSENGKIVFKKPNISPDIMKLILRYLYTGIFNFDKVQILKLLLATDELNLQKLNDYIQNSLIDNHIEYLKNDPAEILRIAFQYEACENLRNLCLNTICENPKILFESQKDPTEILQIVFQYEACEKLRDLCLDTIWENPKILFESQRDPVEILQIIFQHEAYGNLRNLCLGTICENPKILFESPKFISLEQDLIILLLKQDGFADMKEIEIWEFILKWALAKMSTQHNVNNLSQWSLNDFEELKKILHDLIPHIRWFQISPDDFWKKVDQFEQIFPRQLYKDIVRYYSDPNTPPINAILPLRQKISVLIDSNHLSIIVNWIDKKEKFSYNISYSVNLLYRASRDGFKAVKKFHRLCSNNKGPTIMISKLKGNGQLIGGYNPLSWQSYYNNNRNNPGCWQHTQDGFLFSFAKKEKISSAFIVRVANERENHAIGHRISAVSILEDNFEQYVFSPHRHGQLDPSIVEDHEVFQVIKK